MWITTILVGATIALIIKWYVDRTHKLSTFRRSGIPGPQPHFLFGNWMVLMKDGMRGNLIEWSKKYGKTFGYYEGDVPSLATSDLELLRQVLVKEFPSFNSRKLHKISSSSQNSIVHARGETWKKQRMILSPSFSTRGIKEMSSIVNQTISKLMDLLRKRAEEDKAFDIMLDFQKLTISAIASCGFGLDVDAVNNPDDIFLKKCQEVFAFRPSFYAKYTLLLSLIFPSIYPFCKALFPGHFSLPTEWFSQTSKAIIDARRENKGIRKDFIYLMLLAEEQEQPQELESLEVDVSRDTTTEAETKPCKSSGNGRSMTMAEMQASCMSFIIAGFETTSTTMAYIAYELALHPEIQEKLQREVDEHFPEDQLPDYLSAQKLPYMEMVFSETLRLFPPAQVVQNRQCMADVAVKGMNLKKGYQVQVLVDVIHKDPEHWGPEDPDEFVPERFLPERKAKRDSMAWMPFGGGPRNCVGMRFAIMEIKMTLARVLKEFTFVRCEETQVPINVDNRGLARPKDGVFIKLEKRQ